MTFRKRFSEFWYFHKVKVIVALLVVVMLSVLIWNLFEKPYYDLKVAVWCGHTENRMEIGSLDKLLVEYASDRNGDGKINLLVKDVSNSFAMPETERAAIFQDPEQLIFFLDKEAYEDLKSNAFSRWEEGSSSEEELRREFVELDKRYPDGKYLDGVAYALYDSGLYQKFIEEDRASAATFGGLYLMLRRQHSDVEKDASAFEDSARIVDTIITESSAIR